jgi:D-arabinose 5-phosphate isomerase GutQ
MSVVALPNALELGERSSPTQDAGRRVLRIEAEALFALAESLDGRFEQAVERLAQTRGRTVVTGMGKSGHIGRKIAATLASTGTPALYVHPAEASHGDLGMIASDDTVLALSNSGETPELADIVAYTRRFSIALLAIVGRADSSLAAAADLTLVLPPRPEACPIGLAPTTSSTAMLALGDALGWRSWSGAGSGHASSACCIRAASWARSSCGSRISCTAATRCRWSGSTPRCRRSCWR